MGNPRDRIRVRYAPEHLEARLSPSGVTPAHVEPAMSTPRFIAQVITLATTPTRIVRETPPKPGSPEPITPIPPTPPPSDGSPPTSDPTAPGGTTEPA